MAEQLVVMATWWEKRSVAAPSWIDKAAGRLLARSEYNPEHPLTDCWEWRGATDGKEGYGRVRIGGQKWSAHRLAYFVWCGPIKDGYQIHHKCTNVKCVNPLHLEMVTNLQNQRRKRGEKKERQMTTRVQLAGVLAHMVDAFLSRHGCFPLDRTSDRDKEWNDAMVEAYKMVGQPGTEDREAKLHNLRVEDVEEERMRTRESWT